MDARAVPAVGDRRLVLLLTAFITVFWGLNWPAMKVAVAELGPLFFRTVNIYVAACGLFLLVRLSGERLRPQPGELRRLFPVALVIVGGWHLFTGLGLTLIEGGRAAIVAYTMPVWAAIAGRFVLGERLGWRVAVALLLGLCGVLVLVWPDLGRLGDRPLGAALILAAAISWGLGSVMLKAGRWSLDVLALTGWQLVLGGTVVVAAWLLADPVPDLAHLTWRGVVGTLYASTIALVLCYAAFIKMVTLLPPTIVGISILATPVVGLYSSALLLGEPAGWRELAALALVLPAIALVLLRR
ncbi:putative cystine transporter YijE [bacterium HR39]|nr:putative cystine transporter YijE [bacterium HR39]